MSADAAPRMQMRRGIIVVNEGGEWTFTLPNDYEVETTLTLDEAFTRIDEWWAASIGLIKDHR